jgi:hypothetical protein
MGSMAALGRVSSERYLSRWARDSDGAVWLALSPSRTRSHFNQARVG